MHVTDTIILIGWIAFWIYWFARMVGVKQGRTRWGQFAGFRIVIFVVIVFVVRAGAFKNQTITDNAWRQGIGLALFAAGLGLAIWARLYIGRNWGSPMSQKDDPDLVRTGPYARIRHPIYSGILLAVIGTAVAVSWFWLFIGVVMAAYFGYSAFMEERYMTSQFPDSYPGYKHSTKMFVPFVA
jgi:protein-S-isoprenylcysteine O-methyltransferase Ste14